MNTQYSKAVTYALIVALGGFVFGLDAAVVSGTVRYISAEFDLTNMQLGVVVSAPSLGAIIALLIAGKLSDKFGRKHTLIGIAGLYLFSAIGSALSTSFEMLTAARFVGGLAFCSLSIASMYIGEISPDKVRGKLVSANQLSIVLGLSSTYFINYFLVSNLSEGSLFFSEANIWRTMFATEIIPALIWFILLFKVPQSPRWLISKDQDAKAKAILVELYQNEEESTAVYRDIRSRIENFSQPKYLHQIHALFSTRMRKMVLIGVTIAIVQGITGMNAILFYAPTVFEQIGFSGNAAFQQATYVGIVSFIFTVFAILFIDKVGRKPLIVLGLTAAVISHTMCWYGFNNASYMVTEKSVQSLSAVMDTAPLEPLINQSFEKDTEFKQALSSVLDTSTLKKDEATIIEASIHINPVLVLIGILAFIAAFHISIGPIMWVLFSEIFPNSVRSAAIPMCALVTSIASYLIQQFFPWQLANMGAANTFLSYAGFSLIGLVVLFFLLPETKNKSIEEIELALSRS